jgi:Na+/melibiose symporter-like transporter
MGQHPHRRRLCRTVMDSPHYSPSSFHLPSLPFELSVCDNENCFQYVVGPLWALSFLIPWFPWSSDGSSFLAFFHFVTSICLFDTFLTYVLMVHCALLCDITLNNQERNKLNNFNAFGSLIGGILIMMSYVYWDKQNLWNFRLFCLATSSNSFYIFWMTHLLVETY